MNKERFFNKKKVVCYLVIAIVIAIAAEVTVLALLNRSNTDNSLNILLDQVSLMSRRQI